MSILLIPHVIMDIPLTNPEIIWMLIGERLAAGYSMYIDVVDDNGPLSAAVYWLTHLLAGKSLLVYRYTGVLILLFQAVYFNRLLIRYKSFEENTYIPAFVLTVLFFISFDLITLSPALLGSTFVLLALGQLFSLTVLHEESPEPFLLVGLFGGIAFCFHSPFLVFLPFIIITGIIVSGFNFNQTLLSLTGYLLPFALCSTYYFWIDGLDEFIYGFVLGPHLVEYYHFMSLVDVTILFALPLSLMFMGIILGTLLKRLTVNQQKQNQLILFYLLFSIMPLFIAKERASFQLLTLLPAMAFFISQLFIYIKNTRVSTFIFYTFLLGVPSIGYTWAYYQLETDGLEAYLVDGGPAYELTRSSKVLVLGTELGYYRDASLAGPYLNYHLSEDLLKKEKSFEELTQIYLSLVEEKPEYIIDKNGVLAELIESLPALKHLYTEKEGVFYLKTP